MRVQSHIKPPRFCISSFLCLLIGVLFIWFNLLTTSHATTYYVDVNSTTHGNGLDPVMPMSSIRTVLETYDLVPGDEIYVAEGTYDERDAEGKLQIDDAGIAVQAWPNRGRPTIRAAFELMAANIRLQGLNITSPESRNSCVQVHVLGNGVTLSDLQIDNCSPDEEPTNGDGIFVGGDQVTIENTSISGRLRNGIQTVIGNENGTRELVIRGVEVNGNIQNNGMLLRQVINLTLENSSVQGANQKGFAEMYSIFITGNGLIVGNVVDERRNTSPIGGIYLRSFTGQIHSNQIYANSGIALTLLGSGDVLATNNAIGVAVKSPDNESSAIDIRPANHIEHDASLIFVNNSIASQSKNEPVFDLNNDGRDGPVLLTLMNNIIISDGAPLIAIRGDMPADLASEHNLFLALRHQDGRFMLGSNELTLAEWATATNQEAGSFIGNPQFVSNTDFHLTDQSPAIDAGAVNPAPATDIDGEARDGAPDIGADEFVTSPPPAEEGEENPTDPIAEDESSTEETAASASNGSSSGGCALPATGSPSAIPMAMTWLVLLAVVLAARNRIQLSRSRP